jgi:hypothetical protein
MARATMVVKSGETRDVKLSPAPILPAMSFPISNQTGMDIRVVVDGKRIRIEREGS